MLEAGFLQVAKEVVHFGLHIFDLTWSRSSCPACPACACGDCTPIIQEKVPEALTAALTFAQERCSSSSEASAACSEGWTFSLFWFGLVSGVILSSVLWTLFILAARGIRTASSPGSSSSSASAPVTSASTEVAQRPPLALAEGEPANPRTLRALGLVR